MTDYTLRPATDSDLPAIAAMSARYDTAWLGAPQRSDAEVAEELGQATETVLVLGPDGPAGAAASAGPHTFLIVDATSAPAPVLEALAGWLSEHRGTIEVFSGDEQLQQALASIGWAHERSAFELTRAVDGSWRPDPPQWPAGVRATDMRAVSPEQVHELIYHHAGWADVPGHVNRDLASWQSTFVTDRDPPEQQVLLWRGEQLVAAALGRIFDDGAGWVAQLAVAKSERRTGLGRALLLEAFGRRIAAGATSVGLGVQAENDAAIALYTGIGLQVVREWRIFAPRVPA